MKFFFVAIEDFSYRNLDEMKQKLRLLKSFNVVFFNIATFEIISMKFQYNRYGLGFEIGSGYLHDLSYIYKQQLQ